MKYSTWLTAVVALVGACKASILRIQSVDDFLNFTQRVNVELETFKGTTVLLETDLDMTDVDDFEPIGTMATNKEEFSGVFDGQGHHIGNLTYTATSRVSGIFGYANGAKIRNLIVDDTCTFTNNFVLPSDPKNHTSCYVGSIVGACISSVGECEISNCTTHAKIVYNGMNPNYGAYVGGVVGFCWGHNYNCIIKDSINTGHIIAGGDGSSMNNIVGGVVGVCGSSLAVNTVCSVTYSVNTGSIAYIGKTKWIILGGIAGGCGINEYLTSCNISKCVSDGKQTFNVTSESGTKHIGGLVGITIAGSETKDSYWAQSIYGEGIGFSIGKSSVSNCNKYDNSVPLSTPWKFTENAIAITSGELIRGLAENNMGDVLREWIDSSYTISFESNTYDKIGAKRTGFLETVNVNGTVPQNDKDEAFGGWFVSNSFIFQLPNPCVLRKNITVYGYWTAHPEIDAAPLYKPLQITLSLFIIFIFNLFL